MFCPKCKDEFRPGFTRCANCDVDLVENLSGPARASAPAGPAIPAGSPLSLIEYCGFVSLEDARRARDLLLGDAIGSEIAIRARAGGTGGDGATPEEYWLRVDRARYKDVVKLLGFDEAQAPVEEEHGSFACGECGREVSAEETFCAGCGARFEEG
jgi:hypothetical protein